VSKNFTELTVKALPIGKHFDASTPAFGLRVGKHRKTWIVQRGTDRRIIRVGHYPAMTLSEARTKGKQLLAATQLNHERVTLQQAYDLFCKVYLPSKKPRTQYDYKRVLTRHYLPTLAVKRLDAITSHMTTAITDGLVHTPAELIQATSVGKTFFKWCIRRHYLTVSPLQSAELPRPKKRKRVLTDDELKEIWRAATFFSGSYGMLVKLIILTGLRRQECASIQLTWVNRDSITLPAEVVKNSHEFTFPIGSLAIQLLTNRMSNQPILLPSYPGGKLPFSTFSVTKKEFDKLHNVKGYTLHDLRRTFRTNLSRLRIPRDICERLINHRSARSDLDEIYDQYDQWDEQVEAVHKHNDWLGSIVG
jgi:integrase